MNSSRAEGVDVVIVSYNSSDHLRSCVEPLLSTGELNVIVVDNASTDQSLGTIADLPVTVAAEAVNRGFAHGCNRGWRLGRAPYVLFLNPDAQISPAAIRTLVDVLNGDMSIGIVGPRIVNEDGSLALSQHRFPRVRSTFSEALYLHHLWPGRAWSSETVWDLDRYAQSCDVEWLSGACLLVRRDLVERLGGFDEAFFMYSEDTELCRAAWSCGFRVRYEPASVAVHAGGRSAPRSTLLPVLARSRLLYAAKNYPRVLVIAHRIGIALEAVTHAILCKGGLPARRGYVGSLRAAVAHTYARPTRGQVSEVGVEL
jgi:GT2 family glycosyltransferase